jgi:hypothetical protein
VLEVVKNSPVEGCAVGAGLGAGEKFKFYVLAQLRWLLGQRFSLTCTLARQKEGTPL